MTPSSAKTAAGRSGPVRRLRWLALGALALLAAGCTAQGPSPTASQGFGPTVAFDTVDGPPPQVFQRLVRVLETEGAARNMSVISREANPSYRVRSYYAAQVERGSRRASISWVWDIYDVDQNRAMRLSGTEPAGAAGRDAWEAADDAVLRKISQKGLSELATLVNGGMPASPAPPVPETAGPAVAAVSGGEAPAADAAPQALAFSSQ